MKRDVLPTIRTLNVNPLHGSEKPRHDKKKLFQKSRVKTILVNFIDWQGVTTKNLFRRVKLSMQCITKV